MSKVLIVGDCHFSDKPPASRMDDYQTAGLRKLNFITELAETVKPDMALFLGDLFHNKRPQSVSHYLVNAINKRMSRIKAVCETYLILGNHDVPVDGKSVAYYPVSNLVVKPLPSIYSVGAYDFLPYHYNFPFTVEAIVKRVNELYQGRPIVLAVHNSLSFRSWFPFATIELADLLPQLKGKVKAVFYGHIHAGFGPQQYNDVVIFNPGSIMRVSASKDDQAKVPRVALFDTDTFEFTFYEIPVEPFDAICKPNLRRSGRQVKHVSSFASALQNKVVVAPTVDGVMHVVRGAVTSDELYKLIEELINGI